MKEEGQMSPGVDDVVGKPPNIQALQDVLLKVAVPGKLLS
jgi:hypothetical protein